MFQKLFSRFKLEKLYFDVIDDRGNCFIFYWAQLKLIVFNFTYSSILFSDEFNQTYQKSCLKKIHKPTGTDKIPYQHNDFQFNGNWTRIDPPVSLLLFEDENKHRVFWQCIYPKSQAEIYFRNKNYKGLGYVESIIVEILPLQLPIHELRWGRFLSSGNSVVWIQWKGKNPLNKLCFNGRWYDDAVFNEDGITFNQGRKNLLFVNPISIRSGSLGNLFSKMIWFKFLFKKTIFRIHEQKFKAKTELYLEKEMTDEGWSVYETVIWGK